MAPGVYFPKEKMKTTTSNLPDENTTYSFAMGFGFTAGVGASLMISPTIGVKMEVTPTYAYANLTQKKDVSATGTTMYIYQNDTPTPTQNGPNTYYEHSQPRYSFSSVALKLGIFIDL